LSAGSGKGIDDEVVRLIVVAKQPNLVVRYVSCRMAALGCDAADRARNRWQRKHKPNSPVPIAARAHPTHNSPRTWAQNGPPYSLVAATLDLFLSLGRTTSCIVGLMHTLAARTKRGPVILRVCCYCPVLLEATVWCGPPDSCGPCMQCND
jgi:hypothetical protein